jgi:hypothetical protein
VRGATSEASVPQHADTKADEEDAGRAFEPAPERAFARSRCASACAKAHSNRQYAAVITAMVAAIAAYVATPRCVAGSMKSGKNAM